VNAIDEFARTNGVGLIACGRRQNHTIAERLFVGSVSAGLLRRVACPILIVPEDGDGDADTITTLLTGIDHWPREQWPLQVESFGIRNQEHHVRIAVEAEGLRSARCVAQDYRLQTMTYDDHEERLSVFLADTAPTPNVFTLRFADVTSLTLFTDIEGNDMRLTFENANGRGTITVELPKRSSTAEAANA
jgi:hypothetical protein